MYIFILSYRFDGYHMVADAFESESDAFRAKNEILARNKARFKLYGEWQYDEVRITSTKLRKS